MSDEARLAKLRELDKEMRAIGRLLSNLADRKKFGKPFEAALKRYDKAEAAWRKLKKETETEE